VRSLRPAHSLDVYTCTRVPPSPGAPISPGMMIALPAMLEAAWARALPGRECAERNEAMRMFFDELARLDHAPRSSFVPARDDAKLSERRVRAACISP